MIYPHHLQEFKESAICDDLIEANFFSLSGRELYDLRNDGKEQKRLNNGRLASADLREWNKCEESSAWGCIPVRPDTNEPHPTFYRLKPDSGSPLCHYRYQDKEGQWCNGTRKYISPAGSGVVIPFPSVPRSTWEKCANLTQQPIGDEKHFWQWLENNDAPIAIPEGEKKGLAALSLGMPSIPICGISMWSVKDENGRRQLHPDIERFCKKGRQITLCPDNDKKESSQISVFWEFYKLGLELKKRGGRVKVAVVPRKLEEAKGAIDDFIYAGGNALELFSKAVSLDDWAAKFFERQDRKRFDLLNEIDRKPDLILDKPFLDEEDFRLISKKRKELGTKLLFIQSPKGSAKSKGVVSPLIEAARLYGLKTLNPVPRRLLGLEQAAKFNIDYYDHHHANHMTGCWDSLHNMIRENDEADKWDFLIVDEGRLGFSHLSTANTQVKKVRPQSFKALETVIDNIMASENGRIVVLDADISEVEIKYLEQLTGEKAMLVLNKNKGPEKELFIHESLEDLQSNVISSAVSSIGSLEAIVECFFEDKTEQEQKEFRDKLHKIDVQIKAIEESGKAGNAAIKAELKKLLTQRAELIEPIFKELQGESEFTPVLFTSDSQKEGETLDNVTQAHLIESISSSKIATNLLRCDSTTDSSPLIKMLVENPNLTIKALMPLAFIYSPSIGVGVSFETGWFKKHFAYYQGCVEPTPMRQQMARDRTSKRWEVFVRERPVVAIDKRFNPDEILNDLSANCIDGVNSSWEMASLLIQEDLRKAFDGCNNKDELVQQDIQSKLKNIVECFSTGNKNNAHMRLMAEVTARRNFALAHHKELFIEQLTTRENFSVVSDIELMPIPGMKEEAKAAKNEIHNSRADTMMDGVEKLSIEEAQDIKNSDCATHKQSLMAEGKLTESFLPGFNLSPDFFKEWKVKSRDKIQKEYLKFLVEFPEVAAISDAKRLARMSWQWEEGNLFYGDLKFSKQQIGFIRDSGLLGLQGERFHKLSDSVREIHAYLKKHKNRMKRLFKINFSREPVSLINRLLAKIGMKTRSTGKITVGDDQRPMTHQIESESLEQLAIRMAHVQRYWDDLSDESKAQFVLGECENLPDYAEAGTPSYQREDPINAVSAHTSRAKAESSSPETQEDDYTPEDFLVYAYSINPRYLDDGIRKFKFKPFLEAAVKWAGKVAEECADRFSWLENRPQFKGEFQQA